MIRRLAALSLLAAAPALAQVAPSGAPVGPNAGAMSGQGTLSDNDGNQGTWRVEAVLSGGNFTGSGTVEIAGQTVTGPLAKGQSYLENGKCYFEIEQGRSHVHLGGPCTTSEIAGRLGGFVAGTEYGTVNGTMSGALRFGRAGAASNAATSTGAGILPTRKLTCAFMDRVGGNVAGDMPDYQLHYSAMVTLTLSPAGRYVTNVGGGAFARQGNAVQLTSGPFAGATGRLIADRSGQPAVYFEREENRRANGSFIVDPGRTACTVARGG